VRKYDLTASPYVYGTAPHKRFAASATPGLAYQVKLADLGLGYDWIKPPKVGTTRNIVVEFVSGDANGNPINHNLQSGQMVRLSAMTFKVANSAGAGTATANGLYCIWVTGPTTFIAAVFAAKIAAAGYGWVDDSAGPQVVKGTAAVSPHSQNWPFEF